MLFNGNDLSFKGNGLLVLAGTPKCTQPVLCWHKSGMDVLIQRDSSDVYKQPDNLIAHCLSLRYQMSSLPGDLHYGWLGLEQD